MLHLKNIPINRLFCSVQPSRNWGLHHERVKTVQTRKRGCCTERVKLLSASHLYFYYCFDHLFLGLLLLSILDSEYIVSSFIMKVCKLKFSAAHCETDNKVTLNYKKKPSCIKALFVITNVHKHISCTMNK